MNKYEICFESYQGDPGKRKHPLTDYCKEGYRFDSKTDKPLDIPRCQDWYGSWNGSCSDLKPCKISRNSGPKRGQLAY